MGETVVGQSVTTTIFPSMIKTSKRLGTGSVNSVEFSPINC